jgi:hypothetical protein
MGTNLGESIVVGEQQCQDHADSKQVLDLEGINIGVMSGFVIVEHEVDDVGGRADEKELECGQVKRVGKSPE